MQSHHSRTSRARWNQKQRDVCSDYIPRNKRTGHDQLRLRDWVIFVWTSLSCVTAVVENTNRRTLNLPLPLVNDASECAYRVSHRKYGVRRLSWFGGVFRHYSARLGRTLRRASKVSIHFKEWTQILLLHQRDSRFRTNTAFLGANWFSVGRPSKTLVGEAYGEGAARSCHHAGRRYSI